MISLQTKTRDLSIDRLKAIAIFGVLTIHTCSYGYSAAFWSFDWVSAVFWGCLVRASVPVFLMCSGALMLDPEKEVPIKTLFTKYLPRMVTAMLFWAAAYKVYWLMEAGKLTLPSFLQGLKEVVVFNQEFHLYYLHIILLVYLLLPVTRLITKHATKRELEYFLAVWFVLGILLPFLINFWPFSLLVGIPQKWIMNIAYASVGYGVFGFFLKKHGGQRIAPYLLLFAAGFLTVFGGTLAFSLREGKLAKLFLEGMSPGVFLMAAGLFGLVTRLKSRGTAGGAALEISKASFCIYLVHLFFLYISNDMGITLKLLPAVVSIPLMALAVFACSDLVYLVLSHIPIAKKYLI
jgi:surface polysaccharide O-acyltransferase-like enzyme